MGAKVVSGDKDLYADLKRWRASSKGRTGKVPKDLQRRIGGLAEVLGPERVGREFNLDISDVKAWKLRYCKRRKEGSESYPPFIELEEFRSSVNRKLWFAVIGPLVVGIGGLFCAMIAFARPIPVVALDHEGRPVLFKDTVTPRVEMQQVRIKHFAKEFLESWALVDSERVPENYSESLNMMTPRLRRLVASDGDELARRTDQESWNLRAKFLEIDTKIADYRPDNVNARIYMVVVARIRLTPQKGDPSQEKFQHLYTELALQRVPVTEHSVYGLLVEYCETKFFESEEELELFALKKG